MNFRKTFSAARSLLALCALTLTTSCGAYIPGTPQPEYFLDLTAGQGGALNVTTRTGETTCIEANNCEYSLLGGEMVQIEARPGDGFDFDRWDGLPCGANPCQFEVTSDLQAVGHFRTL